MLRELDRQARLQGGAVYMLNGNHESLNVAGNFRRAFSPISALLGDWFYSQQSLAEVPCQLPWAEAARQLLCPQERPFLP